MQPIFHTLLICTGCLVPFIGAAQTVYSEIKVTLLEAPNDSDYNVGDVYMLYLSYDSSQLLGIGEEVILVGDIVSLRFDFNGATYDERDDVASDYPRLYFSDSKLVGMDYWNSNGIEGGGDKSFFSFYKDQSFSYSPYGSSEFTGVYTMSVVPEVQSTTLLSYGLWLLLVRRKRN